MILIIDCGSSKTPSIEDCVNEFSEYKTIAILSLKEEDLKDVTGIIISGAPILVTEIDFSIYLEKTAFIKTTLLPVLGICFGHQLIGLHFGSFAERIKEDRNLQEIEVIEDCPIFDKLPAIFNMIEDHCETISIPNEFNLVAISDACINEAMQHQTKKIYGVQFHPEVSGNHGRIVFENFYRLTLN